MARPKRSLSDLLDVDQGELATEPARTPTMLAVAPALPVDQPIEEPAPVVEVIAEPEAAPEAAAPQDADAAALPSIPDPAASAAAEQPSAPTALPGNSARSRTPSPVRSIKAAPEPPPLPLYLELTRKEARFRQDQLNDLTTLTRQLNRRRASTGERITDNTLIRVAVDMMLKVADSLDGATEAELLQAVSAKLKR